MENIEILEETLEKPYLLLTPGPLTTSNTVRKAMLKDWCTWDDEYNNLVQDLRKRLLKLGTDRIDKYTVVLMQGSGTFAVESVITTAIRPQDKLLILSNGAYGDRIESICKVSKINYITYRVSQTKIHDIDVVKKYLEEDPSITHVAVIHSETTSGILNPIEKIGEIVKRKGKIFIVDAMSSFGGVKIDIDAIGIDFLISSSNKCIQGVPGFGYIIANTEKLKDTKGQARSLSLDIYDQWEVMENNNGKWRFTSPTHVVRAFYQALLELEAEGGVEKRFERYKENQKKLVEGMKKIGIFPIIENDYQGPIITTFLAPDTKKYNFKTFYNKLKEEGFVIYPGKLTSEESFRIGNIGEVYPEDIERLIKTIENNMFWEK